MASRLPPDPIWLQAHGPPFSPEFFSQSFLSSVLLNSSTMHSSRGPPPHGAAPSPTNCSNTHSAVPSSFHTPEPMPSSPHFFTMNPPMDQRLTGPMMPYQPVDHHPLSSSSTCHDSVPWQYPAPWDPVLDASASSENPSSNALHTLGGMASPSHEGSSYAPSLPPTRAVQNRNHILGATEACPFPATRHDVPPVWSAMDHQDPWPLCGYQAAPFENRNPGAHNPTGIAATGNDQRQAPQVPNQDNAGHAPREEIRIPQEQASVVLDRT